MIWCWTAAIAVFSLGGAIELTQHLMYRNRFEWEDLLADTLGILIVTLPRVVPGIVRDPA